MRRSKEACFMPSSWQGRGKSATEGEDIKGTNARWQNTAWVG
ncbi:hypothetical protein SynA1562_01554 [Synechococcus sp. A15-62]|nr:hypothetical protein SynA1562_01554 [Synechococcus sp. A15-62]